jgi:hypothetical protein
VEGAITPQTTDKPFAIIRKPFKMDRLQEIAGYNGFILNYDVAYAFGCVF